MLPITKYYKVGLYFSSVLIILSIFVLIRFGLNYGIDFKGGSLLDLKFSKSVDARKMADDLIGTGYKNVIVQPTSANEVLVKTQALDNLQDKQKLEENLKTNFGDFEELRFDSIGPLIGQELRQKAYWQIALVILGILLYLAYAFRKISTGRVSKKITSWRLSWAAVIALAHDLVIVLGIFAVLGKFWNVEVDSLFITALLTILGFSVHDTIVVFDRLRENIQRQLGMSFSEVLNYSFNQTLTRSINTSVTVLFVLLSLALFGGQTIFYFVLALIIGIFFGTYSSIFVASALLLVWNRE